MRNARLARVNLLPGEARVLAGLAKGRRQAIEQAKLRGAVNAKLVMQASLKDLAEGNPARGRAKRIAHALPPDRFDRLGRQLTERSVKRILDKLLVCPIQVAQNPGQLEVTHHAT